jgi:RNA polymerase sigma-70 factor (ECF subfamily)
MQFSQAHVLQMTDRARSPVDTKDEALMAHVQNGDTGAFEALFDRYGAAALGLAARILSDKSLAEEVVQEAFLRIWNQSASFDPGRGTFVNWMFTITHRAAIDKLRKQKRASLKALASEEWEEQFVDPAALPEEQLLETDQLDARRKAVCSALARLPAEQLRVIELAFFQGMTRKEIAEQTGEPVGTIHTRARLALGKLRTELDAVRESEG